MEMSCVFLCKSNSFPLRTIVEHQDSLGNRDKQQFGNGSFAIMLACSRLRDSGESANMRKRVRRNAWGLVSARVLFSRSEFLFVLPGTGYADDYPELLICFELTNI